MTVHMDATYSASAYRSEVNDSLPVSYTHLLSSPGGGGYNELRIEDRKGQEQIFVHAQRDWDENIEHDQKIRVGHQRHDTCLLYTSHRDHPLAGGAA